MRLTIGFSPCPNDTFMVDAIINHRIETGGIEFEPVVEDVEQLNKRALKGELDITKMSFHCYLYCLKTYQLLHAGSALGFGVGPLLVARSPLSPDEVGSGTVAIPGEYTTAHLLFKLCYPDASQKVFMPFDEIENAILNGKVDAGVIIHENRFTYMDKGLVKIIDLGSWWESESAAAIPLGGFFANKRLNPLAIQPVENLLRESIRYAFDNPEASAGFVEHYAQAMEPEVRQKHIQLYVNEFSLDLGLEGMRAINKLIQLSDNLHLTEKNPVPG